MWLRFHAKRFDYNRRTRLWHLKQSGGMRVVELVIYIIGATKGRRELTAKRVVTLRAQCVPLMGVVNGTHQPIKINCVRLSNKAAPFKGEERGESPRHPICGNGLQRPHYIQILQDALVRGRTCS